MDKGGAADLLAALKAANAWANRRAGALFLLGLVGVAFYQRRAWRKDQATVALRNPTPALPALNDWPRLPLVTVLVAAWNEAKHIEAHIESFLRLHYPHKELVLAAGGSDGTLELARRYAQGSVVILEQQPGEGKQCALRRAFEYARGQVIYLTDADCRLDDDSFERVVLPVASGQEFVVTGSSRPLAEQLTDPFVISQAASQLYAAMHSPAYAPGLLGRNCAVAAQALRDSGGLDLPASSGTDYVLAKALARIGAAIRQVPDSRIESAYPSTVCAYIQQQRRWLRNVFLHGGYFGASDERRAALRSSLAGVGMLAAPLVGLALGAWAFSSWALVMIQACVSRARYLWASADLLGRRPDGKNYLAIPLFFLVDLLAWARPLWDYLDPHKEQSW